MAKEDPEGLTVMERRFVESYVTFKDPARAVRDAGYRTKGGVAGQKAKGENLLNPQISPRVAAAVAKAFGNLHGTPVMDAKAVLAYIHTVMTFCPIDYFQPGDDGGWLIRPEGFRLLPQAIKQLVEELEFKQVDMGNGKFASMCWVRIVSKTHAMALAAKYQLKDYVEPIAGLGQGGQGSPAIDWDRLSGAGRKPGERPDLAPGVDPVEAKILALESHKTPPPPTDPSPPSSNGKH